MRGRKALADVGLEDKLMQHGIPMRGRMLHDLKGRTQFVPYDPNSNQVTWQSVTVSTLFRIGMEPIRDAPLHRIFNSVTRS